VPPGRVVENAPARLPLARQVGNIGAAQVLVEESGVEAVTRAHRVHAGDLLCGARKAFFSFLRERSMTAQLDHYERHSVRQFLDGGFQVVGSRNFAGFSFVGKKDIHVAQDFEQAALPLVIGIVVGVERDGESGGLEALE